jgi:hypothetical protein
MKRLNKIHSKGKTSNLKYVMNKSLVDIMYTHNKLQIRDE